MAGAALEFRLAAEALLARYLAACEARDVAAITACFAPRAVVIDPISPRICGRAEIAGYFRSLYDDLAALRLTTSPLYWQGDEIACHWQGEARRRTGEVIRYEGIDAFRLSPACRPSGTRRTSCPPT
jgi:ketosteroid isomerase-like protein